MYSTKRICVKSEMYKESENMLKSNNKITVKKLSLNKRESEL